MQYIEMLDRIFRVQDNTRSIRDGHLVVDVGNQGVYNLRRAQSTKTYLLQRVGDLADTQTVYSIKTLDITHYRDRDRIIPATSHAEFNIFCDEVKKKSSPTYTNPFNKDPDVDTVYNYAIEEKKPVPPEPIKVVEATHKHIQMLRNDLDLPDGAIEILNKYAECRKFREEYEQTIKIADVDNIIELDIRNCETFDAFITSLSEYVKINFLRNVTTQYTVNKFVTSINDWKSSTQIAKTIDSSIATSEHRTLYVQLMLMSPEGRRYISFRIPSATRQNLFEIMNYACKITPKEPKYRFAGLEKYIDECKTRVLGDKYNRELQYTTLTGVL